MYGPKSFAVRSLCVLALGGLSPVVLGTDFGNPRGGSDRATANAVAVTHAGAAATGGAGGAGGVGGSVGNVSQENKSYGVGAPGLSASANACQGSVSLVVVGFTYEVAFCRALQEVAMMGAIGMSKESMLNRLCQVDTVAETATECAGRKIQK